MLVVTAAFIIDLAIGDPVYRFHPIRLIGCNLIAPVERLLRRAGLNGKSGGLFFLLLVLLIPAGLVISVGMLLSSFKIIVFIFDIYIVYSCIATKDLWVHVRRVMKRLDEDDIVSARSELSMIVGRETESLDEQAIMRACVETLAENFSDGIIAPMMYAMAGGAPLAIFYKAANTMDSMVGYKDEKYSDFGFFPAKFDDMVNWLPARVSMCLLLAVGIFTCGINRREAIKAAFADRRKHASPNAGHPEAAMAGLLGVRLGGPNRYHGELVVKPWLNESGAEITRVDVVRAWRITLVSAILALLLFGATRIIIEMVVAHGKN